MKRTENEYELTKLAMNGIPTPCELNRSLIAERDKPELSQFLTQTLNVCVFSHLLFSTQTAITQFSIFTSLP